MRRRLLSVESLAPFRAVEPAPVATTTSSDSNKKKRSSRSNRRKSRHDQPPAPRSLSESSSSTLTLTAASPRRSRRHAAQEQQDDEEEEEEDSPSRRHRRDGSHSRSRVHPAAGDEGAGPLAPIRVVHLDRTTWTEIDDPGQSRKGGSEVRVRPGSSHSMKTLPGSRQGKSPVAAGMSGLSITTTNSDHDDDAATADDDFQDAEEGESARGSTRFGTVESYRTAREQGDEDEEDWSTTTGRSRDGRRRHARDLWSQASGKGTDEEVRKPPPPPSLPPASALPRRNRENAADFSFHSGSARPRHRAT